MKAIFRFVENIEEEAFQRFALENSVKTHFLGSYAWGQISTSRGWVPYYVGVEREGKLAATALLLKKKLPLGYSYFYIPRGFTMDYSDLELLEFLTASLRKFCKKHRAIHFKIDPDIRLHTVDQNGNVTEGENNYALSDQLLSMGYSRKPLNYFFEREQPRFTFRVDLQGTPQEVEARYSPTTRNAIRQARSRQVEVVLGTRENIGDFARLMDMTEKRQNFYAHNDAYFQRFYDVFAQRDMVKLYLGKVDVPRLRTRLEGELRAVEGELEALAEATGKKALNKKRDLLDRQKALCDQLIMLADKPMEELIVSACLTVQYMDKSWSLYAGNDRDFGKFFANYLVFHQQIMDAQAEGRKCFDLFGTIGRPDHSNRSGLYEFKKKWGGELTEFIGEFDYVLNPVMYNVYTKLIPYYHDMVKKRLRKQVQSYEG